MDSLDLIRAQPDELISLVVWLAIFVLPVLARIVQAAQKKGGSQSSRGSAKPGSPRRRARDEWARRIREAMEEAGAEFPQPTPVEDKSQPHGAGGAGAASTETEAPRVEARPQKPRPERRSVFADEGAGGGLSEPLSESFSSGDRSGGGASPLGGAFDNEMPTLAGRGSMASGQGAGPARMGGLGGALRGLDRSRSVRTGSPRTPKSRARFRGSWADAIVRAEILGPPVALRGQNDPDATRGPGGGGAPAAPPGLS